MRNSSRDWVVLSTPGGSARLRCSFQNASVGVATPAVSDGPALAQRLEQQHRGRRGHVERSDSAPHRDRDQQIARLGDPAAAAPSPRPRGPGRPFRCSRPGCAGRRAFASAPYTQAPASFAAIRKSDRLVTRATRRCSTAPAEALHAAGVIAAERREGITTPVAPAASAERQIAPRLCVSCTWSSATTSASSASSSVVGLRVGIGVHLGDHALVVGAAREPRQLVRRQVLRRPHVADLRCARAAPRRRAAVRRRSHPRS